MSALSTSQLDSSLRRSQSGAHSVSSSTTNPSHSMAQTQRLLKVLQSHPITRPQSHLPYPHLSSSSSFASSLPPTGRRGASPPPERADGYDVLDGFRRELERIRRDVAKMSAQERQMEERQQQRWRELAASAPPSQTAASGGQSASLNGTLTPSGSLMSTITHLLHSPKLNRRPQDYDLFNQSQSSQDQNGSRRPSASSNAPFSLAPSHAPSPFTSGSLASSPLQSPNSSFMLPPSASSATDPHIVSVFAKSATLLDSQSHALDASQAKLQSLLQQLHSWKEKQALELKERLSKIESKHDQALRQLIERFEAEREKLANQSQKEMATVRQQHQALVEHHVEELNQAVEKEFKKHGSITSGFEPHFSHKALSQSQSTATNDSHLSSSNAKLLDQSLRLEHLDGDTTHSFHTRHAPDSDDDDEKTSAKNGEKRKRLQYSSALNGSYARSSALLSQSQPPASSPAKKALANLPPRQTVASLLYSSEEDEAEDAETLKKNELIAQANYLKNARNKHRFQPSSSAGASTSGNKLDLAASFSRRSRGRSNQQSKREKAAEEQARAEARILLESSSDDEPEVVREDPYARQRHVQSVRFAQSLVPTEEEKYQQAHPAPSPQQRRRTEKAEAAAIFVETSSDEEPDGMTRTLADPEKNFVETSNVAASSITTSSGRLHPTPSKTLRNGVTQPSVSAMAKSFQQRVQLLNKKAEQQQRQQREALRGDAITGDHEQEDE